jgi:hypothetical protein
MKNAQSHYNQKNANLLKWAFTPDSMAIIKRRRNRLGTGGSYLF